jgi:hypothetical protein
MRRLRRSLLDLVPAANARASTRGTSSSEAGMMAVSKKGGGRLT